MSTLSFRTKKVRSEIDLWQRLSKFMGSSWRPQRHDDRSMGGGVPDLSFVMRTPEKRCCTGWMELKVWSPTDVNHRLRHFTEEQRDWLREHYNLGVPVFMMLDMQTHYILIHGEDIQQVGTKKPSDIPNAWLGVDFSSNLITILQDLTDGALHK